ncbi:MAG: tRNA pseudouridine(55) synthase TruB, partial [Chloroflexi bacterium]|nr:tRNA pseudouridine(55) synthase TruB [Chloroflexota bacterium]
MATGYLLNINKPKGVTSHDVVAQVRRLTGERRVGHAGTLDPLATGVLVIYVAKATRLVEYLLDARKVYEAEITFGVSTNTYDAEGEVVARVDSVELSRSELDEGLRAFVG